MSGIVIYDFHGTVSNRDDSPWTILEIVEFLDGFSSLGGRHRGEHSDAAVSKRILLDTNFLMDSSHLQCDVFEVFCDKREHVRANVSHFDRSTEHVPISLNRARQKHFECDFFRIRRMRIVFRLCRQFARKRRKNRAPLRNAFSVSFRDATKTELNTLLQDCVIGTFQRSHPYSSFNSAFRFF